MAFMKSSILRKRRALQAQHVVKFYKTLLYRNMLAFSAHQCRRRAPTSKFLKSRNRFGAFRNQVTCLLTHGTDEEMKRFTGLTFNELHTLYEGIKERIQPKKYSNKLATSAKEKLLMTLSYLRGGWSINYASTHWMVSRWTFAAVLRKVCHEICDFVKRTKDFFPETKDDWQKVADGFEKKWQLPHCLGAVDGKHISIRKFPNAGSINWNYKKFNSIILLAFVDHNYRILHFNVGAPGIRSDGGVFAEDRLGEMIKDCSIELPAPRPLPKDPSGGDVQYYFIGDAAFSSGPHMMNPISGDNLTDEEVNFNYRLSRARMVVECVFGHLTSRFGALKHMTARRDLTILLVRTCCYLHNFLRATRADDIDELRRISKRGRKLFGDRDEEVTQNGTDLQEKMKTYLWTKDYFERKREYS